MWGVHHKDEIVRIFINDITKMGMDIPENHEEIVQFIYEDIMSCGDTIKWNDSDVIIGFRRFIESRSE